MDGAKAYPGDVMKDVRRVGCNRRCRGWGGYVLPLASGYGGRHSFDVKGVTGESLT